MKLMIDGADWRAHTHGWRMAWRWHAWHGDGRQPRNPETNTFSASSHLLPLFDPNMPERQEEQPQQAAKHVRFASLDLVHNLVRRLSASVNDDSNDEGHQHKERGESDDTFVDSHLSAELNQGMPNNNESDDETPPVVNDRNSIIFWRDVRSAKRRRNKSTTAFPRFAAERNSPASRLPMTYRKEAATLLVLTAVATEFIGISISLPILVPYATSFGVPQSMTGLVFSVGAFSNFLSNLWIPIRSDAIGRRRIILGTLIGSCVAYVFEASARTFEVLLLGLFLGGLFGETQPVAVSYISDIYNPVQRPRFIGMVPACASVCFTLGPAIGAYISRATGSYRAPLVFASIVVAGFIPIVHRFLPESRDIISKQEREEIRRLEAAQPERKTGTLTYDRRTTYASHSMGPSELSPLVSKVETRGYRGPHRDFRCYMCLFVEFFRTLG